MKYYTYQEAKIDNPESKIWLWDHHFYNHPPCANNSVECNPADYCMSVMEFLRAGGMFQVGDVCVDAAGIAVNLSLIGADNWNQWCPDDVNRYVLRSSHIAFNVVVKYPEVGSKCLAVFKKHANKGFGEFVVCAYYNGYVWLEYIGELKNKGKHYTALLSEIEFAEFPTETKEEKQKREIVEDAYYLYCMHNDKKRFAPVSFDEFKGKAPLRMNAWIGIVEETNFRRDRYEDQSK